MLTAVIVFAVVVQLTVKNGPAMTFWTRFAALFLGPSIAFTGGVLSLKTQRSWPRL